MKKLLSVFLLLAMVLTMCVPLAGAAGVYEGKTVVLYTGNVRGDIDVYSKIAAVKANYEKEGARVVLVDAGNYLQGKTYANTDRGFSVYNLMDAAGYEVAAMGMYEFVHGDATTGYPYHGNFHKYYTQAELYNGTEELTYARNSKGDVTETRPAKDKANFAVLSSNAAIPDGSFYAADRDTIVSIGDLKLGFVAVSDVERARRNTQDGFMDAVEPMEGEPVLPKGCDLTVCLANAETELEADIMIEILTDGPLSLGAYVIDNKTKEIKFETVALKDAEPTLAALVEKVKAGASPVVATSQITLNGKDSLNRNQETNLGDLTTDALKWYAEEKFDGFKKDVPVVAIQNGGNCDNFLYPGDVTGTDLLRALPFSPMGVGILYVTGGELLETLEAACQKENCSGFAQVAGLTYSISTYKEFDAGQEYGKFYQVKTVNRVEILEVGGKDFDEKATYAVIADNYLMNGNDTYYTFKEIWGSEGRTYLSNGNGMKTRDIVELYLKEVLEGKISDTYDKAQNRITLIHEEPFVNPFKDVAESDWFYDAVRFNYQAGLIKGMTEDTFEPETDLSRAMMVTLLYRMEQEPEASEYENPFEDVEKDAWYTDAICWAAANKIVNGTTETTYEPDETLTREQAAAIFYRYACMKGYDVSELVDFSSYPDAGRVSSWATQEMSWAVGALLINGISMEDGYTYLAPQNSATRAQMATILMRFCDKYAGD